ncbi:hypothetical protein B9Z55_013974 [Caenorhabditis nigoni]|uniref:Uncharacterized protein n=1 Tax=Caenorhabditis nigoni TaxID=1611254 RepID=A0A2G5U413_9PELO|nr:hypothetical protein B9Z55_013974 [Caenorhabditis nigoni]
MVDLQGNILSGQADSHKPTVENERACFKTYKSILLVLCNCMGTDKLIKKVHERPVGPIPSQTMEDVEEKRRWSWPKIP